MAELLSAVEINRDINVIGSIIIGDVEVAQGFKICGTCWVNGCGIAEANGVLCRALSWL